MNLKDMKEGLSSSRKPDLTHIRYAFATYTARPCEYGCDKYERANFLRATGNGPHSEPTAADFERMRKYLRAMVSHGLLVLDSMERHQANDPKLVDVEGMKRAAYAVDTDEDVTGKVGPSLLPHIAMCGSSLMMAIEQAVDCGLLPRDPGTPWRSREKAGEAFSKYLNEHIGAALDKHALNGPYTWVDEERPIGSRKADFEAARQMRVDLEDLQNGQGEFTPEHVALYQKAAAEDGVDVTAPEALVRYARAQFFGKDHVGNKFDTSDVPAPEQPEKGMRW